MKTSDLQIPLHSLDGSYEEFDPSTKSPEKFPVFNKYIMFWKTAAPLFMPFTILYFVRNIFWFKHFGPGLRNSLTSVLYLCYAVVELLIVPFGYVLLRKVADQPLQHLYRILRDTPPHSRFRICCIFNCCAGHAGRMKFFIGLITIGHVAIFGVGMYV